MRNKQEKGFTLIELLVVIAIIGLLASVVLLALNSARARSRDAKRLADVRQISSAIELYVNDNGTYPGAGLAGLTPTYLVSMPTFPTPVDGCNTTSYAYTTTSTNYTITFCLGASAGGFGPGTRVLVNGNIQ